MVMIEAHGQLRLSVLDGADGVTRDLVLAGPVIQVGRGPGNDLVFADPRVSSLHGRLVLEQGRLRYQDLGSTNGSALIRQADRLAVTRGDAKGVELQAGDRIQLGDADRPSEIVFLSLAPAAADRAPAPEATVVAQRALADASGLSSNAAFNGLLKLLAQLRSEDDSQGLTRQVLEFLIQTLPAAATAESALRAEDGSMVPDMVCGQESDPARRSPPPGALIRQLEQRAQALLIEDVQSVADASVSMRTLPSRSLLLAPLLVGKRVIGTIQVGAAPGGRFDERDLELVAILAQQLSAVLSGSETIARLRREEQRLRGQCDYLRERFGQRPAYQEMVGRSEAMVQLKEQITLVAPTRTTVLIQGETGAGKELVARAIHENSPRASAPFAAVNCSALASGLLESELFGHVRGAFTGAHKDRQGLFEVAHQGTLFLDEVGDMPLDLQPKLLRVLEEGLVTPVGSNKPRRVDVRVVCATHRDLDAAVTSGRFRQDLLFRLNVFQLPVPALRARPDDILPLAEHFIGIFAAEHERRPARLGAEAAATLQSYAWPGNVRELKNEIERASLLAAASEQIDPGHFSERLGGAAALDLPAQGTLKEILERLEARVLRTALARHSGNRTHCARELGISRQALVAKIARLGVDEE